MDVVSPQSSPRECAVRASCAARSEVDETIPRNSMYGIDAVSEVNVGIYSIDGEQRLQTLQDCFCSTTLGQLGL